MQTKSDYQAKEDKFIKLPKKPHRRFLFEAKNEHLKRFTNISGGEFI